MVCEFKNLMHHFNINFISGSKMDIFYNVSYKNRYNDFCIAKHNFTILSNLTN